MSSPAAGRLDQFLQQQASEGVHESSREFSVNLVAAQKKLGKYSLPRETAWILKFVQCATEIGCPELHVRLHKDAAEIQFPPGHLGGIEELRLGMDELQPRNPGEDHLFSGLLALHSLGGQLSFESEGKRWYPVETRALESGSGLSLAPKIVYKPTHRSFWDVLRRRIWAQASLLEELRDNCYPSPVQLFVDGRPLQVGRGDIPLLSGLIQGEAGSDLDYYGQIERETGQKNLTFSAWGSSRPSHIAYAVQVRAVEKSLESALSLEWIRSGVVVQRSTVVLLQGRGLLARILIPTRGLRFDASGFAIKDDAVSRAREAKGITFLSTAVEAVKGDLGRARRWEKFLQKSYPEASVMKVESLIEQLDGFVVAGKTHLT